MGNELPDGWRTINNIEVELDRLVLTVSGLYRLKENDFEFHTIVWEDKDITPLFNHLFHNHIEELEIETVKKIKDENL